MKKVKKKKIEKDEWSMHELSLMGEVVRIIEADAKKRNINKVEKVDLIVGDLSNALPEALEMAFEIFKLEKIQILDRNASLIITREQAKAICYLCELEYEPDDRIAICPKCDFPSGKLISGETFAIKSYIGYE